MQQLWTEEEHDFLEQCVLNKIPHRHIQCNIDRTPISIGQRIKSQGIADLRSMHRKYTIEDYRERFLYDLPLKRKENSHNIIWTRPVDLFIRRCYFMDISSQAIANELDIHWRTVYNRIRKLNLKQERERFYRRYCSFYSRYQGLRA